MTDSEKLQKANEGVKAVRQYINNAETLLGDQSSRERVQHYLQQAIVACDEILSPAPADAPPPGVPIAKPVSSADFSKAGGT